MKKNIDLVIDGIAPEKVMYDTDNHSLVVLYPAQREFKKGDILHSDLNNYTYIFHSLKADGAIQFFALNRIDEYGYLRVMDKEPLVGVGFMNNRNNHRLATPEEQQVLFDALKKEGKMWNAEKLQVEDIKKEFKRGDIVIHDNTKRISVFDKLRNDNLRFDAIFGLSRFNDVHDYCSWNTRTLRHATPQEIEQFDNDLKSIGKKWNKETLEIEDLDISEIVVDLVSACEYLEIKRPSFFILDACERSEKFEAQITLQLICEAWNKFDGFEVGWDDYNQDKHYPVLNFDGSIKCYSLIRSSHISASCYSFPTKARAIQFGTQFKDLLKTAMGI